MILPSNMTQIWMFPEKNHQRALGLQSLGILVLDIYLAAKSALELDSVWRLDPKDLPACIKAMTKRRLYGQDKQLKGCFMLFCLWIFDDFCEFSMTVLFQDFDSLSFL